MPFGKRTDQLNVMSSSYKYEFLELNKNETYLINTNINLKI